MPEHVQDEVLSRLERRTRTLVSDAISLISSLGFVRIPAQLDSLTIKDGVKVQLSLSRVQSNRHALMDAQGSVVTITLANAAEILEAPTGHKPTPQQPDLLVHGVINRARDQFNSDGDGEGHGDA
jgi:hypothetical protein